jgi:2-keto-4-pentenoate hydratase/2-oxohepta-3-ene-1,7-dioic acid hydratase in catechol pathway
MAAEAIERAWHKRFGRTEPKLVRDGLNYRDHAREQGVELPAERLLFGKFANALCDPGQPIVLPRDGGHVDAEAELAVVIGRRARRVSAEDALEVVSFGVRQLVAHASTVFTLQPGDVVLNPVVAEE